MDYQVVIIGGGPAGYVAAIRAGQTGLKTLLVEKEKPGGMCLNWGCIPTKTMMETAALFKKMKKASEFGITGIDEKTLAVDWPLLTKRAQKISGQLIKGIEFLLKKNGVEFIQGEATIKTDHEIVVENRRITFDHLIIATGSEIVPLELPFPEEKIVEVKQMFSLEKIPEMLVVYGNNAHAMELAQFFALTGKKALLLYSEILLPGVDPFLTGFLVRQLEKDGVILLQADNHLRISGGILQNDRMEFHYDVVINAGPRKGNIPFSELALSLRDGFIETNDYFQTNYPNIYAVGDVSGKTNLAHAASAAGLAVINHIHGVKEKLDLTRIPMNIYTVPEVAQIGLTEEQCRQQGYPVKISEFPLSANAKSLIEGDREGKIRLLSEEKFGEVLGVQIIAPSATDLIAEAAAYMELEGTIYDVAKVVHAHPTVSEIYMEAGFAAIDKAIHI